MDMSKFELQKAYNHCNSMLYNRSRYTPGKVTLRDSLGTLGMACTTELFVRYRDYYYRELFKIDEFEQLVKERYSETRDAVFAQIDHELDVVLNSLENAQQRNIERWPLTNERKTWVEQYALSENYYAISSLQGHYDHLDATLVDRLSILDRNYLL